MGLVRWAREVIGPDLAMGGRVNKTVRLPTARRAEALKLAFGQLLEFRSRVSQFCLYI